MPDRFCPCGVKMSPRMPRVRDRNGELVCPMCAQNQPRTAARDSHPDVEWKRQHFGVANTSLGRAGFGQYRHLAGATTYGFEDEAGWKHSDPGFSPARHVIDGARAYASELHLPDPHRYSFDHVRQDKETTRAIADHYDSMPMHDASAAPHFHALAKEIHQQGDFMQHRMGIKFESCDYDPYKNVHEMVHDVTNNKRIKVLGTHTTGSHPVLSDHDNDMFRAVHDVFGHAATGRDFDRHGEEAAYRAHSRMFKNPMALRAMGTDLRGQNSSLIKNGEFGAQRLGLLPDHLLRHPDHEEGSSPRVAIRISQTETPTLSGKQMLMHAIAARRPSIVVIAHDSGDGETLFHCPFCGSGQIVARNDGAVDCDFCKTAFTVQVQPQMPAFPQTINGVPIDVPGMPKGGDEADVPPDEAAAAGYPPDEGGSDPEDPMATDPGSTGVDDGIDPEEDSTAPPFAKASSLWATSVLHTASGQPLSREAFMAHLALTRTTDRATTLRRARDYQRS